jgi:hypothetical protein
VSQHGHMVVARQIFACRECPPGNADTPSVPK